MVGDIKHMCGEFRKLSSNNKFL